MIQSALEFANFYNRFVSIYLSISHSHKYMIKNLKWKMRKFAALKKTHFFTKKTRIYFYEQVATLTSPLLPDHLDIKE